ncbi:MAG TPA: hypothetical protein VFH70_10485 [Acidimicrobiales bacterium]|nr:hypothetical protein [Acidimicrobiales bacterium]
MSTHRAVAGRLAAALSTAGLLLLTPGGTASASALDVCASGCPFTQLGPALAAAKNGDTVRIGPGTYTGDVAIKVSVHLVGAGADRTIIDGGGNGTVITIGTFGAPASAEPTVTIDGVTITGGVARSSPESVPFVGSDGVIAMGGGVEVPPDAGGTGGAIVTISHSVIRGNRVAPTSAIDSGIPCPPDITISCINGDLPFAKAAGGGIDAWGPLTLDHTTVTGNRVGSAAGLGPDVASDADGAGIDSHLSPLTIKNSTISGNRAGATAPNGRFAEGGGLYLESGSIAMSDSSVKDNATSLAATMPSDLADSPMADGGGIFVGFGIPSAALRNSRITDNSASMTNTLGDAAADSGGIRGNSPVDMRNVDDSGNSVTAVAVPGSSGRAFSTSGAGQLAGTFRNVALDDNAVTARSASSDAEAGGGASVFGPGTLDNADISGNRVLASGQSGFAAAAGGGLLLSDVTTLRNSQVRDNRVEADGAVAEAAGGGVFDAPVPNGPPGGALVLRNNSITDNVLTGSPGTALLGGGVYVNGENLTASGNRIARNQPDQCIGC